MKCLIPGLNVKVLARAIHSLAKIGDEMYVEPQDEGLSFRTVNCARSAYAAFTFTPSFFSYYENDASSSEDVDDDSTKCKVTMRSCLAVFRSPNSLDRQVETCQLKLESDASKLVFQLRCKHGIVKTHSIPVIECETLQAVYTKDMAPNRLTAQSKMFSDAVMNFHQNLEEITLSVSAQKAYLKNYTENAPDPSRVIHTELCLQPDEFDSYSIGADTSLTFCLKELRAILSFTDAVNLPVTANFEVGGRPIVFVVSNVPTFEATFVLATMTDEPGDSQSIATQDAVRREPRVNGKSDGEKGTSKRKASYSLSKGLNAPSTSEDNTEEDLTVAYEDMSVNEADETNGQMGKPASLRHLDSNCDEEDTVPSTPPPRKRARFFFQRCFESTFDPDRMPGHEKVLAPDSDEES